MQNRIFILFFCLFFIVAKAQDSTVIAIDSVVSHDNNIITNTSALRLVFEKLLELEESKTGTLNIVHIGDSHIQADLFTGVIRKNLQERFGNSGLGFTFPYSLAKTNGTHHIKYASNAVWESYRNIYPVTDKQVGLSGIFLSGKNDFFIAANVTDTAFYFNSLKIITPGNNNNFEVATASKIRLETVITPQVRTHKIKNGEALSLIAQKYGTTITELKKLNGLKNNTIRAGKILKIPGTQIMKSEVRREYFDPLPLVKDSLYYTFYSKEALSKIYLIPAQNLAPYSLNGLVLEKDAPGILYHNIGVNGAKFSDYNKHPLFFEQLPALQPDLIVLSLGTNESFDKMAAEEYIVQLNLFLENIRIKNPDTAIIITTPPPSLFSRKHPNIFVTDYSKKIQIQETERKYASWDLYTVFGGTRGIAANAAEGLIGSDRVHYTKAGYEKQGLLFVKAFLKAYENYKTIKN